MNRSWKMMCLKPQQYFVALFLPRSQGFDSWGGQASVLEAGLKSMRWCLGWCGLASAGVESQALWACHHCTKQFDSFLLFGSRNRLYVEVAPRKLGWGAFKRTGGNLSFSTFVIGAWEQYSDLSTALIVLVLLLWEMLIVNLSSLPGWLCWMLEPEIILDCDSEKIGTRYIFQGINQGQKLHCIHSFGSNSLGATVQDHLAFQGVDVNLNYLHIHLHCRVIFGSLFTFQTQIYDLKFDSWPAPIHS